MKGSNYLSGDRKNSRNCKVKLEKTYDSPHHKDHRVGYSAPHHIVRSLDRMIWTFPLHRNLNQKISEFFQKQVILNVLLYSFFLEVIFIMCQWNIIINEIGKRCAGKFKEMRLLLQPNTLKYIQISDFQKCAPWLSLCLLGCVTIFIWCP